MKATMPTDAQLADLAAANQDDAIAMLNLLKFKTKATYKDDAPEAGQDLTGFEAYLKYGAGVAPVLSGVGGKILYSGPANRFVIGGGELWDMVVIAWYPSRTAFLEMSSSAPYQAIHYHRAAGLEHQQLIETTPAEM